MRDIWRPKHSPGSIRNYTVGMKSIPLLRANGANESLSLDRPFFSARVENASMDPMYKWCGRVR